MNRAISLLQSASTGRAVLILFVLTNVVYGTILGYSIPLVLSFTPESILFDMSPAGYSYAEAIELLKSLGPKGRNVYLTIQIPIDLVYPAMFGVSYALMLTWILKARLPKNSRIYLLAFVPIFAGLFDYLENASIVSMLYAFPDISENLVTTASSFTIAKSVFTTLFFLVLLLALVYLAIWRLKNGQRPIDNKIV